MDSIPTTKHLQPYLAIAEATAAASPCIRGKFGAVIVSYGTDLLYIAESNSRVGKCCKGNTCDRTRLSIPHVQRTEVGAEIHAEIAALIRYGFKDNRDTYFILAGLGPTGEALLDYASYPCHSCAMAIKFAGFNHIYLKNNEGTLAPYSINKILEDREQEWQLT